MSYFAVPGHPPSGDEPGPAQASPPERPLVVTADPDLLDDLLRLAAAAGVEPQVANDTVAARSAWTTAPVVLAGDDLSGALIRAAPARRQGVVLVSRAVDDGEVWERARDVGAEQVVFLPDAESWIVDRLVDVIDGSGRDALTVCVVGGRGGAGATTLATALAVTGVRRGMRSLLLDGDPLGGGIDLVLGGENAGGLRWPELVSASGCLSGRTLGDALPQVNELTVLSWDRGDVLTIPPDAMCSVLGAAQRANELVVIDLPRRMDDAAHEALRRATVTLLLVPAELRATASANRVASLVRLVTADVRVVVRGPAPAGLPGRIVAESLELPLAGEMRAEPGLAQALECGRSPAHRGRGPLAEFCSALLSQLTGDVASDEGSVAA